MPRYRGGANIKGLPNHHRGGNMKFLEKGVYKIFGAMVLVSMVGALIAEPVALGDIGYYAGKELAGESGSVVESYLGTKAGEYAGENAAILLAELFAEEGAEAGTIAGPIGMVVGGIAGAL